ncbi:hypothetical protein BGZ96_002048 [Linnemannia gamsii]|uniref:Uncharacterized protein n=1 Tax=Linnemannia gamsii TaxID=64522 RepID=A0ABQ7KBC2_9FUNG|nr:hypothetical protein BGZ96_002048 [Linnemannia gamsii]
MSAINAPEENYSSAGGISNSHPIDKKHPLSESNPDLERILAQLSETILKAYLTVTSITGSSPTFEPVLYARQVVAGSNYYVKMRVFQQGFPGGNSGRGGDAGDDDAEYIHVKIFDQPWTSTLELTGISVNMKLQDPFEYNMPALPQ